MSCFSCQCVCPGSQRVSSSEHLKSSMSLSLNTNDTNSMSPSLNTNETNAGALIIITRVHYTITIIRNPKIALAIILGPYITWQLPGLASHHAKFTLLDEVDCSKVFTGGDLAVEPPPKPLTLNPKTQNPKTSKPPLF